MVVDVVVWVDQAAWLLSFSFSFFFFLLWTEVVVVVVVVVMVVVASGCVWFLKFVVDVFIIILMSFLYYFNQIAKNIDLLIFGVL